MKRALLVAVALVALVVIVGATAAVTHWLGRPLSEFPTWLTASASVAAFVAAVLAVTYAGAVYRLESERDEQRLDLERRAQASLVAAWWGPGTYGAESRQAPMRPHDWVWIRNASELPVTAAVINLSIDDEYVATQPLGTVPPDVEPKSVGFESGELEQRLSRIAAGAEEASVDVDLWFTDASGNGWNRAPRGALKFLDYP